MVSCRLPIGDRGLGLAELLIVVGLLALLAGVGGPYYLGAWRALRLTGAAQQLAAVLGQARQIAISQNRQACVRAAARTVQILVGSATPCATGAVWRGPGTDAAGQVALTEDVRVSTAGAGVVFNYLGAAVTPASYTVTHPRGPETRRVVVATSGRISIR